MTDTYEIVLHGCTPVPLANYLKGLGLLRVLSRHDATLTAKWRGEHLVLNSQFDSEQIRDYLLNDYQPTPALSPWNGASGFYKPGSKAANIVSTISSGSAARLTPFRQCINIARECIEQLGLTEKPGSKEIKHALLVRLRATLPDSALEWFDSAILLTNDDEQYPPLLGSGGNVGNLDFTNNFMQRLLDLIDPETGLPGAASHDWLNMALFDKPAPAMQKSAIGQFAPGQIGGPNSTTGFTQKGKINPWDFVLMIEGALPFAAAAVRRNAQEGNGVLSYPFTVRATAAGAGNLGSDDAGTARGELWMPLWPQAASYPEIRALLAEGRVALGKRPAKDALDFIRAVHRLGSYRGVDRFQRFGLLKRSGENHIATPLERVHIGRPSNTQWLDDLDSNNWLDKFRKFSQADTTANHFASLRRRLEDSLFELARRDSNPIQVQALLRLLGKIQQALSTSSKAREPVPPVPRLSEKWLIAADNNEPSYRIALALCGLRGGINTAKKPISLPLHSQLFPIHPLKHQWMENACSAKGMRGDATCRIRLCYPDRGNLEQKLASLLQHRLRLGQQLDLIDKPLNSSTGIGPSDLHHFLNHPDADRDIAALLPGLSLCQFPTTMPSAPILADSLVRAPAAYALMKLCLIPNSTLSTMKLIDKDTVIPVPQGLLANLHADNPHRAIEIAWRRLRGSGLNPIMNRQNLPGFSHISAHRLAAALAIPLNLKATRALANSVLASKNENQNQEQEA